MVWMQTVIIDWFISNYIYLEQLRKTYTYEDDSNEIDHFVFMPRVLGHFLWVMILYQ